MADKKPKTFAEWQQLRKSNPRLYYRSDTQNQILQDASALGKDAFYIRKSGDE